jgi:hypothetical protein
VLLAHLAPSVKVPTRAWYYKSGPRTNDEGSPGRR